MKTKRMGQFLMAAAVLVFGVAAVQGAIINVDIGGFVPMAGWNTLGAYDGITNGTLLEDLVDSTDAATTVDLRLTDAWSASPIRNGSAGYTGLTMFSPQNDHATQYSYYFYEGDADHTADTRWKG